MPTGLKVPVGVNRSGGAAIESNEGEQLKKLLFLAFAEGGDTNAFQELGISKTLIFSVQGASFRGKALRAIEAVLSKFRDRVKLRPDSPITFEDKGDGEIELSFEYIDKFTDRSEEFRTSFQK